MLQELLQYAQRTGLHAEPGFQAKAIPFALHFSMTGVYRNASRLGTDKRGQSFTCPNWSQPEMKNLGRAAHYLAESVELVLLLSDEERSAAEQKKLEDKHHAFVKQITGSAHLHPALQGMADNLSDAAQRAVMLGHLHELKAKPTDKLTLYVDETPLLENEALLNWWRSHRTTAVQTANKAKGRKSAAGRHMVSVLDGRQITPALTHGPVKGLSRVGGLPTGSMLACFDKEAFESYGLSQGENAALDEETASAYTSTLSHLADKASVQLGKSLFVHWYAREIPKEDDFVFCLDEYTPEEQAQIDAMKGKQADLDAIQLLRAVYTTKVQDIADTRFYGLVMGASAARVRIREFWVDSLKQTSTHLMNWFEDFDVLWSDRKHGSRPPGPRPRFEEVLQCLADHRDKEFDRKYADQISEPLATGLLDAALRGGPVSLEALERATRLSLLWFHRRDKADYFRFNQLQAWRLGLIKLYHKRMGDIDMHPAVNPQHPSPAYQCGRLVAVLENLQRAALPKVNTSVADRFLGAAAQSPSLVLGQLNLGAHVHLRKLEGSNAGGLATWYRRQIAEINASIRDQFPSALSLADQSLFSLGYWQQVAEVERRKQAGISKDEPEKGDA
jgi:CRISPR-associated protein Csd1